MSPTGISANRLELLQIADAVAKEKAIDKEIVLSAMAEAIEKAAASKYGAENKIRVDINNDTGSIRLLRVLEVVEEVEDTFRQINLKDAKKINPDASIDGSTVEEELPPIDFGRVARRRRAGRFNARAHSSQKDAEGFENSVLATSEKLAPFC